MSRRIRAMEHGNCAAGLADAHPGLQAGADTGGMHTSTRPKEVLI